MCSSTLNGSLSQDSDGGVPSHPQTRNELRECRRKMDKWIFLYWITSWAVVTQFPLRWSLWTDQWAGPAKISQLPSQHSPFPYNWGSIFGKDPASWYANITTIFCRELIGRCWVPSKLAATTIAFKQLTKTPLFLVFVKIDREKDYVCISDTPPYKMTSPTLGTKVVTSSLSLKSCPEVNKE